jgi:hypothetical protein
MPSKIEKTAFSKRTNASARRCGWSPGQTEAVAQASTTFSSPRYPTFRNDILHC